MRFQYFINDFDPEKAEEVGYVELDPASAVPGGIFPLADPHRTVEVIATAFPKRMLKVRVIDAF